MTRLVVLGICLVVAVELLELLLDARPILLGVSGVAAGLPLLAFRRLLGRDDSAMPDPAGSDAEQPLRGWLSRAEILLHWSESTRTDWDRHWRPMLARRFENATGQSRRTDPAGFDATGEMLFGATLWQWVDPSNVAQGGGRGPGRAVLEDILQRLERV